MRKSKKEYSGLNAKQLFLLLFSFLLGIAMVYTLDKTVLSTNQHPHAAHAAVNNE
ncbi:MAG: hypothetical protein ACRC2T_17920 [Thermoguttaceae bacterium]